MPLANLDAVADHMLSSYSHTRTYSRQFRDDHGTPPTLMSKLHHNRSVLQGLLNSDDRFELEESFVEFGKVQFIDSKTGTSFVLRSMGTHAVEKVRSASQAPLFSINGMVQLSPVQILVYDYTEHGLTLFLAKAAQRVSGSRLAIVGDPVEIGTWPFLPDESSSVPFDQQGGDSFNDVGRLTDSDEQDGTQ